MSFTNPIPRALRPRYYEASDLRSRRDGDVVARGWQKNRSVESGHFRIGQATEQIQRQLNRLRIRRGSSESVANPFKIYRGSTWLKFKVSNGWVATTGVPFHPTNPDTELTLTAGVELYYIYLDITTSTATFATSATTPTWAVNKVLIGWVDTLTGVADERSKIHQFYPKHLLSPCV